MAGVIEGARGDQVLLGLLGQDEELEFYSKCCEKLL